MEAGNRRKFSREFKIESGTSVKKRSVRSKLRIGIRILGWPEVIKTWLETITERNRNRMIDKLTIESCIINVCQGLLKPRCLPSD